MLSVLKQKPDTMGRMILEIVKAIHAFLSCLCFTLPASAASTEYVTNVGPPHHFQTHIIFNDERRNSETHKNNS